MRTIEKFFGPIFSPTIFLSIILNLNGCSLNSNDSIAKVKKIGEYHELTLTGRRENMAHDPISYIFRGSSPSSIKILVPRINGEVNGDEIPVKSGYYNYVGSIVFYEKTALINLSFNNTDDKKLEIFSWNGKYKLE